MELIGGVFVKNYEWESLSFPLIITFIQGEFGLYNFPTHSTIEVMRDEQYNLKAKIYGITNDRNAWEYRHLNDSERAGQFIEGENFVGYNSDRSLKYELKDCYVKTVQTTASGNPAFPFYFEADLGLFSLTEFNKNNQQNTETLIDWYLTGPTQIRFPRYTERYSVGKKIKVRPSLNEESDNEDILNLRGGHWDCFQIQLEDFSLVIQKISPQLLPPWGNGIAIEYRTSWGHIPSQEIRTAIPEILSFMLGIEIFAVGFSEFDSEMNISKRYARNYLGGNDIKLCQQPERPPIRWPKFQERTNIEPILNQIIPIYLSLRNPLELNIAIWKHWVAKNSVIGTNLPILSSAIEGVCEKYLKHYNKIEKLDNETKKRYTSLRKKYQGFMDEIKAYPFGQNVINKIENPSNYSGGEKLKMFFDSLDINFDKDSIESEALKNRNTMAHSSIDNSMESMKKAVRLTRAYETLFNRVMLKILKYEGKYKDYYTLGHPERELSENIKCDH